MLTNIFRLQATTFGTIARAFDSTNDRAVLTTPGQARSPSYPQCPGGECSGEWDLILDEQNIRAAGGEILFLFGQVLDVLGRPISGARVEIWQCDLAGRHVFRPGECEDGAMCPDFRGFGAGLTEGNGHFRFRTILPLADPGRAPHIHARVSARGHRALTTQLYLLDDERNNDDPHFRRLNFDKQAAVLLDPVRRQGGDFGAGFNFVL